MNQTKVDDKDVVEEASWLDSKAAINPLQAHITANYVDETGFVKMPQQQAVSTEPHILRDKEVSCSGIEQPGLYPAHAALINKTASKSVFDFPTLFNEQTFAGQIIAEFTTLTELNKGLVEAVCILPEGAEIQEGDFVNQKVNDFILYTRKVDYSITLQKIMYAFEARQLNAELNCEPSHQWQFERIILRNGKPVIYAKAQPKEAGSE